jgi:uncharacterized protein YmfQ (DUF2313 family)
MPAPALTEDDFLTSLQARLPRGRAWPRDPDSNLTAFLRGFAAAQAVAHVQQSALLTDAFPIETHHLLPEWQATLGLPDPCAGPDQSYETQISHVKARIENTGGQSIPYLIGYAAALGFTITCTEFTTTVVGDRVGSRLNGANWAYALQINAAAATITYARANISVVGDPLASWGNAVLECEMRRVAPGHLYLLFSYSS